MKYLAIFFVLAILCFLLLGGCGTVGNSLIFAAAETVSSGWAK